MHGAADSDWRRSCLLELFSTLARQRRLVGNCGPVGPDCMLLLAGHDAWTPSVKYNSWDTLGWHAALPLVLFVFVSCRCCVCSRMCMNSDGEEGVAGLNAAAIR